MAAECEAVLTDHQRAMLEEFRAKARAKIKAGQPKGKADGQAGESKQAPPRPESAKAKADR